jgi:hypothetical protein
LILLLILNNINNCGKQLDYYRELENNSIGINFTDPNLDNNSFSSENSKMNDKNSDDLFQDK